MKPGIYTRNFTRKGMLVSIMVFLLGISANTIAVKYWSDSHDHFMAVKVSAEGFRARQMAVGGFQAGLISIKKIPEEFLYKTGLALNPPDILLSQECKPRCMISYRLLPEDGKLNVNNLVVSESDEPNGQFRPIFERFFRNYELSEPEAMVDAIIDWMDENNNREVNGAEEYYSQLNPVVKIKNFKLFSLSEICQIKGITHKMIYTSQAPENWAEIRAELKFLTEDEKNLIQEADWIPANNLTAFMISEGSISDKININAARYHVLMSLTESMTKEAVLALFKLRREKGNYIKNLGDLRNLAEFQIKLAEFSLYDELVGTGGDVSGLIKSKGEIYRIVGVGSIIPVLEGSGTKPVVRKVTGLYDTNRKKLIYYAED